MNMQVSLWPKSLRTDCLRRAVQSYNSFRVEWPAFPRSALPPRDNRNIAKLTHRTQVYMKELRELQQQYPGLVQLLTRKDVARLAGVSTATIKRDVKRGLLKEIAPNARRRRYHPKDVEAYLAAKFPALAYTKRRLSTIQTAGNPSGGDVETPDGNDSPARPDAKMAGSGAKGADCPENPPKAQQREVSRPIMHFFCRTPHAPVFQPNPTTRELQFDRSDGLGQPPLFSKILLQIFADAWLRRRAIELWRVPAAFRNN